MANLMLGNLANKIKYTGELLCDVTRGWRILATWVVYSRCQPSLNEAVPCTEPHLNATLHLTHGNAALGIQTCMQDKRDPSSEALRMFPLPLQPVLISTSLLTSSSSSTTTPHPQHDFLHSTPSYFQTPHLSAR